MGGFVISTKPEQQEMLKAIGLSSMVELYQDASADLILKGPLNLPEGMSEMQVRSVMEGIAAKNKVFSHIFRGAGAYDHYIPSIVKQVPAKEEFLSTYTPYQAEVSQGILQSIFEYQTMICELTGLDISNASAYDGASSSAEAVKMCRSRKRCKVLVSGACHPDVLDVVKTYCHSDGIELEVVPAKDGLTDLDAMRTMLDDTTACMLIQQPAYLGGIEDAAKIGELVHEAGALFVMNCNPFAITMYQSPAECGADIAVGEGQPMGMPLSFGGPYLGFMACKTAQMRQMPGRIVGQTVDLEGRRAFVLTLQAREQHIKREKALSSICSNQALCALTSSVYMSAMGPGGMAEVASQCHSKAHYLAAELQKIPGFELKTKGEFFQEFVTGCKGCPDELMKKLAERDILGGLPLENGDILWCCTEKNSKESIDALVAVVKEVCGK